MGRLSRIIALTGGIGSGKTAVSDHFARLGVPVIDTDVIARELGKAGAAGTEAVAAWLGREYLTADGAIDRARLRARVFGDAEAKRQLDQLFHPLIQRQVEQDLAAVAPDHSYCLLVVPLLFETGTYVAIADRILVVDCDPDIQISRVQARSGLDIAQIQAIMSHQIDRDSRRRRADDLIDGNQPLEKVQQRVAELHEFYLSWAGDRNAVQDSQSAAPDLSN
ncbi:dephospho-CoA kinase [Chitinimonas lacunae]|uniref:Dephospho-CoA kinase n=1 Tax=Chitinimonas lacunae TaxID=1963018 RepID=A0ABV8MPB6_9NEIS